MARVGFGIFTSSIVMLVKDNPVQVHQTQEPANARRDHLLNYILR